LGPALAGDLPTPSFGAPTSVVRHLKGADKRAVNLAYTSSLQKMWIFYTAFAACGILISLFITKKELSRQHEKAKTGIEEQERVRQAEKAARKERRDMADAEKAANRRSV